jgi:hypothetical protein
MERKVLREFSLTTTITIQNIHQYIKRIETAGKFKKGMLK